MSVKVTDLDRAVARNIKSLRTSKGLTQPQVADFLGVTFQSYQKVEGGRISFRASTLDRLSRLYGVSVQETMGNEAGEVSEKGHPPLVVRLIALLSDMPEEDRRVVLELVLQLRHG